MIQQTPSLKHLIIAPQHSDRAMAPPPPTTSRKRAKVYRRSFVGCWTCRRRKVKCDASRPKCERCIRAKVDCEGYDVKLNWSTPLSIVNGEFRSLTGEDPDAESAASIQRSNIALVRWWLYDYYNDMDNDLSDLERGVRLKAGPFGVFKHKEMESRRLGSRRMSKDNSSRSQLMRVSPLTASSTPPSASETPSVPPPPLLRRNKPLDPTTPVDFTLLGPFKDLTNRTLKYRGKITPLRQLLLSDMHLIKRFIDFVPGLFDSAIQPRLDSLIKEAVGAYFISESPMDLSLLMSVVALVLLRLCRTTDTQALHKAIAYRHHIYTIVAGQAPDMVTGYKSLPFLLILLMMINSTLGVYDPQLFQYSFPDSAPLSSYYTFFQATNTLFNHCQFSFNDKFFKIYADMLDPEYNLLKHHAEPKRKTAGDIRISVDDTPEDKIMRVPKYIDEDAEDENEPAPPSFTIHFVGTQTVGLEDKMNSEGGEEYEEEDEVQILPLTNVFEIKVKKEDSVYGVSATLVELYRQLCQLVNHKRHFYFVNMASRNFAKVCADFEDVLIRQVPKNELTGEDEAWYHLLLVIYFKLVKNYPKSMLKFHLKKIRDYEGSSGLFKFFTVFSGDVEWKVEGSAVWSNNWKLKEWIWRNQGDSFKDWAYDDSAPTGVFIF